jgi:putative ABC transport system permease protein
MLTPRWHKVIRDLWSNKTKTILVVLAIAVGLFAFGSVFITQEILVTSMDEQYRETNSSDIVFTTDSFDESLLRWIREQPEVEQVQGKASYMLKMYGGEKTYNLTLIAYDDNSNITMNKITPEQGVWPPGRKEISFERTSLPLTQVQVGDTVTVELSSGKKYDLTVSGTVHDLNAFPGTMVPLPTAYVSWSTLEYLGFSGQSNQINIIVKENYLDTSTQETVTLNSGHGQSNSSLIPRLETVASTLKSRLEDRGLTVYSTQVKDASEHWAKSVTQSFVLILTGLGIFSLILSGFLVVNTITALITQQKRQIGMMKAVGGTGRQIISLYMVLVTCYGLLALLIAVPVSLGLGYFFMTLVANLLNIDITGFHMPVRVFLLEFGAAILIPVIAAGIPILGGVRIPVREALSDYGLSGKIKTGFFDRMLLQVKILSRPMLLSLRNTFRRKGRLALTMGTLILAGTLFIGVMNIRASLDSEFEAVFKKYYDWEVALGLDGNYPVRGIEARTLNIPGVTGVESQAYINAQRIKEDGTRGASFYLTGVNLDSTFVTPDIQSGRWIEISDKNALVLTSGLAKNWPDIGIGDTVTLRINGQEKDWQVVGLINQEWENTAYTDFNYVSRLNGTSGMTSSIYIKTAQKDGNSQTAMAEEVEDRLKKSGIKVGSSITQNTIVSANAGQIDFLIYFLLIMAILSAIIGALGLMGMMSLNVLERTREIGVMRSIGAKSSSIGWIVITEGLIIGIVSWIVAIPVSIPMTMIFNSLMGTLMFGSALSFVFSPLGLGIWLAIVLVMAFVASILPAYRAMRMSVRETLAYE